MNYVSKWWKGAHQKHRIPAGVIHYQDTVIGDIHKGLLFKPWRHLSLLEAQDSNYMVKCHGKNNNNNNLTLIQSSLTSSYFLFSLLFIPPSLEKF